MKTIHVVAAIIREGEKLFATQRGYGEYKDKWEFPGGKVEENETPEDALIREIKEELEADIAITGYLMTVEYDYPSFHLSMDCFVASLKKVPLSASKSTKQQSGSDRMSWIRWTGFLQISRL